MVSVVHLSGYLRDPLGVDEDIGAPFFDRHAGGFLEQLKPPSVGVRDGAVTRIERQVADGAWAYASLIDMRGGTAWLSFDQMAGVTCAMPERSPKNLGRVGH